MPPLSTTLCLLLSSFSPPQESTFAPPPIPSNSSKATAKAQLSQLKQLFKEIEARHPASYPLSWSPVETLPLEILGHIFLNTCPTVLDIDDRNDLLNLGLVCKRWRSATLLTPSLWSGISNSISHSNGLRSYAKVSAWLKRSGCVPKTLEWWTDILSCKMNQHHHGNPTTQVLILILTEGPPLDSLMLGCCSLTCFLNLRKALEAATISSPSPPSPRPWDTLQAFHLWTVDGEPHLDASYPWDQFYRHLPTVRRLRLHVQPYGSFNSADFVLYGTPHRLGTLHIPHHILNNLTSFTIHYELGGAHVFTALEHCTNLETLSVDASCCMRRVRYDHYSEEYMSVNLRRSPLVLPKLRTLHVQQSETYPFLQCLKAPNIQCLEIGDIYPFGSGGAGYLSIYDLADFLDRSNLRSTLKSLRLHFLHVEKQEISSNLSNLVALEELTLNRVVTHAEIWNSIEVEVWTAIRMCSGCEFPSLTRLSLLGLPHDYPLLRMAAWIAYRRHQPLCRPCRVTVSYNPRSESWNSYPDVKNILDAIQNFREVTVYKIPGEKRRSSSF